MSNVSEGQPSYRKKNAGNIFAVDRRTWSHVCQIGFDAACVYIVMASGTQGNNRTTGWSATAVETRAGMRWYPANEALELLKERGVIRQDKAGTRPRYFLMPADQIPGCILDDGALSAEEQHVLSVIRRDCEQDDYALIGTSKSYRFPRVANPYRVAKALEAKRLVSWSHGFYFQAVPQSETPKPEADWIWLPTAIVNGAGTETPPIKLLRRTRNLLALRLFVDLYGSHFLNRHCGIDWRYPHGIRSTFNRYKIGERGPFVVWGFTPKSEFTSWQDSKLLTPYGAARATSENADFWAAFGLLRRHGLIEMVPHLISAEVGPEHPEPDLLHPLPIDNGEPGERAITLAAMQAARVLVTQGQWDFAISRKNAPIVPVAAEFEQVQLIGIPRLRYRPHTEATARWYRDGSEQWAETAARFGEIEASIIDERRQALKRSSM